MQTQHLTLEEFADMLRLETQLGIVDGAKVMAAMMKKGSKGLPKKILDIRGALRLALARAEDGFEVTTYVTDLSKEALLENIGMEMAY